MSVASVGTHTREFRLPDLGEGLTESEIVAWRVAVGDTVQLNQVIGEVETAKAVVELPSPYTGKVTALLAEPGQVVAVGAPIAEFEVEGQEPGGGSRGGAPKREPNLVGYGAMPEGTGRPARKVRSWAGAAPVAQAAPAAPAQTAPEVSEAPAARAQTAPAAPVEPAAPAAPDRESPAAAPAHRDAQPVAPAEPERAERPRSTPPVRKLAKDLGVDLGTVRGSGPRGLVTRDDVLSRVGTPEPDGLGHEGTAQAGPEQGGPVQVRPEQGGPAQGAAAAVVRGERETRTPIRGVRKHTAAAMVASAFSAPHASEFLTVDVTPAMELLARLKASRAFAGVKLTPMTLVAKAVLIALPRSPSLNSHWDEAAQEIVQYNYVNLGFAAATPRGLVVPNIKDADSMDLAQLADAISQLATSAREGHASPADLSGGTITITNIGVFGVDAGTPILNPGEAAILAMGQVRRLPWEHRGEVALRDVMTLSLSFDHRLVDGEQGSRFLADVGAIMADPGTVLAMV